MTPLVQRWMKTPEQGAQTSIHLASAPELETVTGQYFANSTPKKSSKRSYSQADADRLWRVSAALVGLESDTERSTKLP
jgi:retinol dehydrogenase 14